VIGVDAASEVQRQMEVQQRGIWTGTQDGALFFLGLGAKRRLGTGRWCGRRCDFGGPSRRPAVPDRGVIGDPLQGQKGDPAFLEGHKAAFNFAFGLRAGRDLVRDAQGGEGPLELRM